MCYHVTQYKQKCQKWYTCSMIENLIYTIQQVYICGCEFECPHSLSQLETKDGA